MLDALPADPIQIGAPIVAAFAFVATYVQASQLQQGPLSRRWVYVRREWLPALDRLKRDRDIGYAGYTLDPEEYAGTIDEPIEEVEERLWEAGFRRNPLAAIKTLPDDRMEKGSWAYRDGLFDDRQLHVMLFENEDGGTDVYAHDEYSAIHPTHAVKHYRGVDYSPEIGEERLHELLPEDVWSRVGESVAGATSVEA